MSLIQQFLKSVLPTVKADDELVDPQVKLREKCRKQSKCAELQKKLEECTARVTSRSKTEETCSEEVIFWVSCVDHCVSHDLFKHLK